MEFEPPKSAGYRPGSINYMITKSLGYCCPYAFFVLYRSNKVIADRLGVSTRMVGMRRGDALEAGCQASRGACGGTGCLNPLVESKLEAARAALRKG